jgi:uncharacterized glyoxalase superfamily protein PhnB
MGGDVNRSSAAPAGWSTITPRLVARDAAGLVKFLKRVFDATGDFLEAAPSVLRIGDSQLMISEAGARAPMTAFLHVYVADADAAHRRAVAAGARTIEEPFDTPYGDRRCMVEDRWGNTWQIATHARPRAGAPGGR